MLAHLDLDAFFASVEELENPSLAGWPLVVGGEAFSRGVVSTANYEARKYGIHSAMSSAEARKLCPFATFVRPNIKLYRNYSLRVWDLVGKMVSGMEQLGLDEAYLELGDISPKVAIRKVKEIQGRIKKELGLSCSLGVARTRVVAKVASDYKKPGGLVIISPGGEAAFLNPLDIRVLPGVGPKCETRLRALGINVIGDLAKLSSQELSIVIPGKNGKSLRERARGIDADCLFDPQPRLSYSQEETFSSDISDLARLKDEIDSQALWLSKRLTKQNLAAKTISCKVRYPDFTIRTRSRTLLQAIDDPKRIAEVGYALLLRALIDRNEPLRLLGLRVAGFDKEHQLTLF